MKGNPNGTGQPVVLPVPGRRWTTFTGTLIIFDRRDDAPDITERTVFSKVTSPAGRGITLLRA